MSSITIRNVVGHGVFELPTTESAANAATQALNTILEGIPWFKYDDARILIGAPNQSSVQELMFLIKTFFYNGSIIPDVDSLRNSLTTALLANPDINSIGSIFINGADPGAIFWQQWPEIEWVDSVNGIVKFIDNIPAGAQIELGKFCRYRTGPHVRMGVPYPVPHLGKRFRRMLRLPVDETQIDMNTYIRNPGSHKRNVFRARFIWPAPPGTLAPASGVVGPLAPYGIVTAIAHELTHHVRILLEAGPSKFSYNHD